VSGGGGGGEYTPWPVWDAPSRLTTGEGIAVTERTAASKATILVGVNMTRECVG